MRAPVAILLALVTWCTSSPKPNGNVVRDDAKEPTVPASASAPASAQLTFVGRRREHPPLSTLEVDVSLRNPGERARWFLLPASTGKGQPPMATSAFGVSVWSFPGTGNVVVAEFSSAGSFYAIQLPPGAEVELRSLKIGLAGEPWTDPLPLEVIVADSFTMGGEAPVTWTKTPATCEPRADATQKGAKRLLEKNTPDLGAVPIELQGAEHLTATLAIPK
jgi:hypothetical protein